MIMAGERSGGGMVLGSIVSQRRRSCRKPPKGLNVRTHAYVRVGAREAGHRGASGNGGEGLEGERIGGRVAHRPAYDGRAGL